MFSTVKILFNNEFNSQKHSVYHVKLTDSALRTFEELCARNSKANLKIRFDGQQGVIQLPVKQSSELVKTYSFTLAAESKDGCTDCFVQSDGLQLYKNIGVFSQKLTIQASEDVYQNTLEKMSIVESESKKNCTKEIKLKVHEKKFANIKSKQSASSTPVETKKFVPVSKPKQSTESQNKLKPQSSKPDSSVNVTCRINARLQPAGKRPAFDDSIDMNISPVPPPNELKSISPVIVTSNEDSQGSGRRSRIAHSIPRKPQYKPDSASSQPETTEVISKEKDDDSSDQQNSLNERSIYVSDYAKRYDGYRELYDVIIPRTEKVHRLCADLEKEEFASPPYKEVLASIYYEICGSPTITPLKEQCKKFREIHKIMAELYEKIEAIDNQNSDT